MVSCNDSKDNYKSFYEIFQDVIEDKARELNDQTIKGGVPTHNSTFQLGRSEWACV